MWDLPGTNRRRQSDVTFAQNHWEAEGLCDKNGGKKSGGLNGEHLGGEGLFEKLSELFAASLVVELRK